MSFEFKEYINYINNKRFDKANEYRLNNSPKVLVKYIGLFASEICSQNSSIICNNNSQKNEAQFYALENNLLWMPTFDNLNDPFEFNSVYIDKRSMDTQGLEISQLGKMLDIIKKMYLVTAFSSNLTDSMPMWAHYANNHQGFSIKYIVENPKFLYPVSYESERNAVSSTIMQLLDKYCYFDKTKNFEYDDSTKLCLNILYHIAIIKHKSWKYESEYRLIYFNSKNSKKGELIPIDKIGLKVDSIYVGTNCSKVNKEKLINIANKLRCDINEMYLDEYNPLFELSSRKLNVKC